MARPNCFSAHLLSSRWPPSGSRASGAGKAGLGTGQTPLLGSSSLALICWVFNERLWGVGQGDDQLERRLHQDFAQQPGELHPAVETFSGRVCDPLAMGRF